MKTELYINGQRADTDGGTLVLMNYTAADLERPAVVRNSWSQDVTLPGTPGNDKLFGCFWRSDRRTGDGDFNPLVRIPFAIYAETGERLESGYCKLVSVARTGREARSYRVTLYGGLGEFLYGLSFNAQGDALTLADLDYLGTGDPGELDFAITANAVKQAWARAGAGDGSSKWDVVNFAACYDGIPDGLFDPGAAIVTLSACGLETSVTEEGKTYTGKGGKSVVKLANELDGMEAHDFRSYLQRPVLSIEALMKAIARPENNGGYSVDWSDVENVLGNLWMTLPLLTTSEAFKQQTGAAGWTFAADMAAPVLTRLKITTTLPAGTKVTAQTRLTLKAVDVPSGETGRKPWGSYAAYGRKFGFQCVMFAQAVAYGADGTAVGAGKVRSWHDLSGITPEGLAERCGFVPTYGGSGAANFEPSEGLGVWEFDRTGGGYVFGVVPFGVEAEDVTEVRYVLRTFEVKTVDGAIDSTANLGSQVAFYGETSYAQRVLCDTAAEAVTGATSVAYTTGTELRSNAWITKRIILGGTESPAAYLLGLVKAFGLVMDVDHGEREVRIMSRDSWFVDETEDLTGKVDESAEKTVKPYALEVKWYDWEFPEVGGRFAEEYEELYGRPYARQRVNTGYDFDDTAEDVLSGTPFRSAATVLGQSRYFVYLEESGRQIPAPFIDSGNTYTLWAADGSSIERSVPEALNGAGYIARYDVDDSEKLEFRDKDNKAVDGAGVLCILNVKVNYADYRLSDDTAAMTELNGGKPCWIIDPVTDGGLTVPIFRTLEVDENGNVERSTDMGLPAAVDVPKLGYPERATMYARRWEAYISDRYGADSRVMTCRVKLPYKVTAADLRRFYHYEGALWVLNKVNNFVPGGEGTTEVELVRVQSKDNYTGGQN